MPADEVYKSPMPTVGGDRESGCSCWIEVLDAEVINTDPNYSEYYFSFTSQPTCSIGCPVFASEYWSGQECAGCSFNPNCCSEWTVFPENVSFNCFIPAYSNFQVGIWSIQYNDGLPGCGFGNLNYSSITFRMACSEVCEEGAWYPVYSEPMTLTQDPSDPLNGNPSGYFNLTGCGCEPELPF